MCYRSRTGGLFNAKLAPIAGLPLKQFIIVFTQVGEMNYCLTFSAAFFLMFAAIAPATAKNLHFYTYSMEAADLAAPMLARAYARLGYSLTVEAMPPKRSLEAANRGVSDGEFVRVGGLSDRFENLIQIPIPLIEVATVVIIPAGSSFNPKTWADLGAVKFGVLRGMQLARLRTHGMRKVIVDDAVGLLEMVSRGRLDAAVLHLNTARKYDDDVRGLTVLYPALEQTPLFHYVHKRHRHLVPKLIEFLNAEIRAQG